MHQLCTTFSTDQRKLDDGKTPYSRLRGREWRVAISPFGECIEFMRRGHKFESQWAKGIFLGVKDNTTEKIVGTGHDQEFSLFSPLEGSQASRSMTLSC